MGQLLHLLDYSQQSPGFHGAYWSGYWGIVDASHRRISIFSQQSWENNLLVSLNVFHAFELGFSHLHPQVYFPTASPNLSISFSFFFSNCRKTVIYHIHGRMSLAAFTDFILNIEPRSSLVI